MNTKADIIKVKGNLYVKNVWLYKNGKLRLIELTSESQWAGEFTELRDLLRVSAAITKLFGDSTGIHWVPANRNGHGVKFINV